MSEPEAERQLLEQLARALADELPTSEASVQRAEQAGVEHAGALPPGLERYAPPGPNRRASDPRPPEPRGVEPRATNQREDSAGARLRRQLATHGVAAMLGAAAALALALGTRERPEPQTGSSPAAEELPSSSASAAGPAAPLRLEVAAACGAGECCAGAGCAAPQPGLESCASGRRCVACSAQALARSSYRVRVGSFLPNEDGARVLRGVPDELQLCVRAGASAASCGPARPSQGQGGAWQALPLIVSAQDLLAGLELELSAPGRGQPLARWRSPVSLSAHGLCRGLVAQPASVDKDVVLGSVSLFFTDAHWVELARAGSLAELEPLIRRTQLQGAPLVRADSDAPAPRRWVLAVGPLSAQQAERLRWQAVELGLDARETVARDWRGEPDVLSGAEAAPGAGGGPTDVPGR